MANKDLLREQALKTEAKFIAEALQTRFSTLDAPISGFGHTGSIIEPAVIFDIFPDYDFRVDIEKADAIFVVDEFPHQLITDNYTGAHVLDHANLLALLNIAHKTHVALADVGDPTPLVDACSYVGLTKRGYIDLCVLASVVSMLAPRGHIGLAVKITCMPKIPRSIATIKLSVDRVPETLKWQYVGTLVGDYTAEQREYIAQELYYEHAQFDKATDRFVFDHYPLSLRVVGENCYD